MKSAYEKARDFFGKSTLEYSDIDVLCLEQLLLEQDSLIQNEERHSADDWQPIETVPYDGRLSILRSSYDGGWNLAFCHYQAPVPCGAVVWDLEWEDFDGWKPWGEKIK